jgi:carbon monoxide dehydrogenase subunit G
MPECATTVRIEAPSGRVFDALSDFANAPKRISGIKRVEMITNGAVGVGTAFRETRVMFGREATETMEVTRFEPGRAYELTAKSCGCLYRSELRVNPIGASASEVTMTFNATPQTFIAKAMSFLMKGMMKSCAKAILTDLTEVKTSIESGRG